MQYDQQTAEWTSQLVEYQMEATDMLEAGKLSDQLLRAFGRFRTKSLEGRPISPIDEMTRIEKIVVDKGDLKTPNNHYLVKTGRGLPPITGLVNRQFKLVMTLNPVTQGPIALYSDAWDFFRNPDRELNKATVMEGHFTGAAVTRQMSRAPQLLNAPQYQRPNESISQDSREEHPQVISKSSEADTVTHKVSNTEKITSPIIVSAIPAELVGKMIIGRCNSPPDELCPY